MRKENASFETKFISEAGSYLNNADYFAFVELKDYACYVIADGIDTDDMKKSAQQAVTAVIAKFSDMPGMSKAKLKSYMAEAHRTLLEESAEIRLEASILVLVTDYKKARWAHAGNCRLALLHNGAIIETTKDTSLTQRLADSEEIPLDMVSSHEERNNLYAYLGQPGKFSPVISAKHSLEDGDIILLETRGAWENIGDAELLDATDGVSKAEEVCTGLEDVILSQRLDIIENYTIVSIFVNKIYQNPKQGKYKKLITLLVSLAIALTIALTAILVTRYIMNRKNLEKIDAIKEAGVEKLQEEKYEAAKDKLEEYESISVRVKKGTANYDRVQSVKLYCSLAEDLYDASVNVTSQGYKGAIKDVERATQTLDQLKELGEDTTDLYNTLTAFERYATFMQQGDAFIVENSYGEAVTAYSNASDAVDDFDDTSYKKKAEDALESAQTNDKSAQVNENMNSGMNAEQEGGISGATDATALGAFASEVSESGQIIDCVSFVRFTVSVKANRNLSVSGAIGVNNGLIDGFMTSASGEINIDSDKEFHVGSTVGSNYGTMKNVNQSGRGGSVYVTLARSLNCNIGSFAGYNAGRIEHCFSERAITINLSQGDNVYLENSVLLGGFAGKNDGVIENSLTRYGYLDYNVSNITLFGEKGLYLSYISYLETPRYIVYVVGSDSQGPTYTTKCVIYLDEKAQKTGSAEYEEYTLSEFRKAHPAEAAKIDALRGCIVFDAFVPVNNGKTDNCFVVPGVGTGNGVELVSGCGFDELKWNFLLRLHSTVYEP